jgi:hypothetical protein
MQIEPVDWIYGARTLMLLAAFAGFAWALISARRQWAQGIAQNSARLETALGEIRKLSAQVTALGGTLETLATQLHQQASAPRPAPVQAPAIASVNTRGYETAIRMARGGASIEEIVASCGTTRAEAKLLRRLHECGDPRKADAESMKIA